LIVEEGHVALRVLLVFLEFTDLPIKCTKDLLVSCDLLILGTQLALQILVRLLQLQYFLLVVDQQLFVHREQRELRLFELLILLKQRCHSMALLIEVEILRFELRFSVHMLRLESLVHLKKLCIVGFAEFDFQFFSSLLGFEAFSLLLFAVVLVVGELLLHLGVLDLEHFILRF